MLNGLVSFVLVAWVALTILTFAMCRGRDAALVSLIAGWALLPTATYPASVFARPIGFGGSMHALAVPTSILLNKATAIGLGCLCGLLIFDWSLVRRLKPGWFDLPIAAWCLVPVASALANRAPLSLGLSQSRYLALSWGVPYLLGRVYLGDSESLRRLGLGLVLGGLVYAPICLLEFFPGPFLYSLVYGLHPYQSEGATRPFGFRPLGLLEHGNQLGMWVASTAVAAVWLSSTKRMPTVAGVPGRIVALVLAAVCLICQSHGSLALMALAMAVLLYAVRARAGRVVAWGPVARRSVIVVTLCVAALGAGLAARSGSLAGVRSNVKGVFGGIGKNSFTWRLARYEENLPEAAKRPILGGSRPDWSVSRDRTFPEPVALGLWLHALGMFGIVGLTAMTAVLAAPVILLAGRLPLRFWADPSYSPVATAAVLLLINLGDCLFNSTLILPILSAAGGLNSWSARRGSDRRSG